MNATPPTPRDQVTSTQPEFPVFRCTDQAAAMLELSAAATKIVAIVS
jgi:hypothetical protein